MTETRMCTTCQTKPAVSLCAGCLEVGYCSKECQQLDWKTTHKTKCKRRDRELVKAAMTAKAPILPPKLANSNDLTCLHGAPGTTPKMTKILAEFGVCRGTLRDASVLVKGLSKKEVKHLGEAIRSMAVDAILDRQMATVVTCYKVFKSIELYQQFGEEFLINPAHLWSDHERAAWKDVMAVANGGYEGLLVGLRECTYCKCLNP